MSMVAAQCLPTALREFSALNTFILRLEPYYMHLSSSLTSPRSIFTSDWHVLVRGEQSPSIDSAPEVTSISTIQFLAEPSSR